MPKMGGDDKDDKKEESAESKAEKEAAVGEMITCRRKHEILTSQTFRKKLRRRRKKPWSRRERTCTINRSLRGKKNGQSTEKRFWTF